MRAAPLADAVGDCIDDTAAIMSRWRHECLAHNPLLVAAATDLWAHDEDPLYLDHVYHQNT